MKDIKLNVEYHVLESGPYQIVKMLINRISWLEFTRLRCFTSSIEEDITKYLHQNIENYDGNNLKINIKKQNV